jgi:L-alanine-DL-glutamate epimerase-like enolase superfamily enzyme
MIIAAIETFDPLAAADGCISVQQGPGLGIELDPDAISDCVTM